MTEHTLRMRCACGRLQLTANHVSPRVANRVTCCCAGCQAFARRMAPAILDDGNGTERFQVNPAHVAITDGAAHLGCLQQTPKGALRWYATCCDTPLGLTLPSAATPFVGLDVHCIDRTTMEGALHEVLGPMRARVNTPRGDRHTGVGLRALAAMLWHLFPLVLRWWWRGEQKRSPFFEDGQPIVEPTRLYTERRALLGTAGCR